MKKTLTIALLCLILLPVITMPALALTVDANIYPGAFEFDKYPLENDYLIMMSPDDPSDYPFDQFIYGKVNQYGGSVPIDRVYIDYPEDMSDYITADLEYPFVDPDGESEKYVGRADIYIERKIVIEGQDWEGYSADRLYRCELTEVDGHPALVEETGSRVYGENANGGANALYNYDAMVLIDDTNVSGCVVLEYSVHLSYKIIGFGMGFGWEDHWDGFDEAQQDWWNNTLLPDVDEYIKNASDVSIKIIRERVYEGEIGAEAAETQPTPSAQPDSNNFVVNTVADKEEGETSTSIPEVLAIAIIGGGAALAGAGAVAGSGDGGNDSGHRKSRFKMCLHKDFGDAIQYDSRPVTVYARMVEITVDGEEIDRPDLTGAIQITSGGNVSVDNCTMTGNYMGALVSAQSLPGGSNPDKGIVSIFYAGEGGSFRNNVSFRLVGEPYIEYYGKRGSNQLSVLGASGRTFYMDCEAKDFSATPEVAITGSYSGFTAELEPLGENKYRISITDTAEKPLTLEKLRIGIDVEITAKAGDEIYKSTFTVIQCFEGLIADYWGKPKEIRAYADENDKMEKTLIGFSLGVWNQATDELDVTAPDEIDVSFEDEKEVYKLIGITWERDTDSVLDHVTNYVFTAQKPYPSLKTAKGTLKASSGEYTYESEIALIPDIQKYTDDYEKEYEACKKIIEVYMAPRFREKKTAELQEARESLGLEDFQLFRKNCWTVAEISIRQEVQEYIIDEAWYDEAIATAELMVYIGDMAFDIALAPIGGPIAGFLAGQVKSSLLELYSLYASGSNKRSWEHIKEFVYNRLVQTAGSADGAVAVPEVSEPKKLAMWLSCYVIYRIGFHWQFDKDDNKKPIGIAESIKRGLTDFVGKGAGVLLGGFIKDAAKGRWPEKVSLVNKEAELTGKAADAAQTATKAVLDAGDKLAAKADDMVTDTITYVANMLQKYLEILRRGS